MDTLVILDRVVYIVVQIGQFKVVLNHVLAKFISWKVEYMSIDTSIGIDTYI